MSWCRHVGHDGAGIGAWHGLGMYPNLAGIDAWHGLGMYPNPPLAKTYTKVVIRVTQAIPAIGRVLRRVKPRGMSQGSTLGFPQQRIGRHVKHAANRGRSEHQTGHPTSNEQTNTAVQLVRLTWLY